MALSQARELRAKRGQIANEMTAMIESRARWTAEDKQKFDRMDNDQTALKQQIDDIERAEALQSEMRNAPPSPSPITEDGDDPRRKEREVRHRRVFWGVMKNGLYADQYGNRGVSEEDRNFIQEYRDMGSGGGNALQGAGGGYFVPVGFVDEVESAMKWYGDMLKSSTIFTTATGQPLPWPTDNDTTIVGELVGENAEVSDQDVSLGNTVFNAWQFSTKLVKVSNILMQDSAFDLETYLKDKFAIRLGRILNTKFTVGQGSAASEPNGLLTAATAGPIAVGASSNDGGTETGGISIGTDDLVELEHSVDKAYRPGAAFMAHDLTIKVLKKLKDKFGHPIWLPMGGIDANNHDTILGYPYFTNNDLPTVALNTKTVLFGQLKKYMIRQVKELSVLRLVERFAEYGQTAFIGFARYDGNLLDAGTHPVKYLTQAAA